MAGFPGERRNHRQSTQGGDNDKRSSHGSGSLLTSEAGIGFCYQYRPQSAEIPPCPRASENLTRMEENVNAHGAKTQTTQRGSGDPARGAIWMVERQLGLRVGEDPIPAASEGAEGATVRKQLFQPGRKVAGNHPPLVRPVIVAGIQDTAAAERVHAPRLESEPAAIRSDRGEDHQLRDTPGAVDALHLLR